MLLWSILYVIATVSGLEGKNVCKESDYGRFKRQTSNLPYTVADPIQILDYGNFQRTILNSEKANYVEFYYDWCPYCKGFAPYFRRFAASVQRWNEVAVVGAINCAGYGNERVCHDSKVYAAPQMMYYKRNAKSFDDGEKLSAYNSDSSLRHQFSSLIKSEYQQTTPPSWPNLSYLPDSINTVEALWKETFDGINYFAIFADRGGHSTLGTQGILDLWGERGWLTVRQAEETNGLLKSSARLRAPFLIIFQRHNPVPFLVKDITSWDLPPVLIAEVKALRNSI